MKEKIVFLTVVLLSVSSFFAQEKLIDTVYIYDKTFSSARKTQSVYTLTQSDIRKNALSLSEALRFQTPVYIKENGVGMVSSPSFRGTTAQQTAFLWNGININSLFLGQGDINNLGILNYDLVEVKAGGGSVLYGTGAIGGTVHLNHQLKYNKGWKNALLMQYGSFQTLQTRLQTAYSNRDFSVSFSGSHTQSENRYEVPEKDYINRSGAYHNTDISLGLGKKLSDAHEVFMHTQQYSGMQHFPVSSENGNRTKYGTYNLRSMLGWEYRTDKMANQLAAAYLEENFSYFADAEGPKSSGGTGKTLLFKDTYSYRLSPNITAQTLLEYKNTTGEGYNSGIKNVKRDAVSAALLLKYQRAEKMYAEAAIKKEWVQDIQTPVLFSAGMRWNTTDFYALKLNVSKNFRYPTFNDLYWQPGGNLNLKSETAWQAELGNELKAHGFTLSITPYITLIENMIQWRLQPEGYWSPENVNSVRILGADAQLNGKWKTTAGDIGISAGYGYTKSEDRKTGRQLMYVPFHKFFGTLDYAWKGMRVYVQALGNGKTYTTSDESEKDAIKPYLVLNAGASALLGNVWEMGVKVGNLTSQVYETLSYYPMPKRNYTVYVQIHF